MRKRGGLLIRVDKDMTRRAPQNGHPGRLARLSDAAVQFRLPIRFPVKLPLRRTAGMAASLLRMAGPDVSTRHRRRCP